MARLAVAAKGSPQSSTPEAKALCAKLLEEMKKGSPTSLKARPPFEFEHSEAPRIPRLRGFQGSKARTKRALFDHRRQVPLHMAHSRAACAKTIANLTRYLRVSYAYLTRILGASGQPDRTPLSNTPQI